VAVDVTDAEAVAGAIEAALASLGALQVVVNAAGIYPPTSLATATVELHRRTFDVNVLLHRRVRPLARAAAVLRVQGGRGGVDQVAGARARTAGAGERAGSRLGGHAGQPSDRAHGSRARDGAGVGHRFEAGTVESRQRLF
jgi:NAD(P)-dependent dehydrogenase (short-subunit alcohol dehydrogenase family)